MDISFISGSGKFNYRVCAMMIFDGRILAMHDERSPYYYLPGGRVTMGETAENAVIREGEEELGITPGLFALFGSIKRFLQRMSIICTIMNCAFTS